MGASRSAGRMSTVSPSAARRDARDAVRRRPSGCGRTPPHALVPQRRRRPVADRDEQAAAALDVAGQRRGRFGARAGHVRQEDRARSRPGCAPAARRACTCDRKLLPPARSAASRKNDLVLVAHRARIAVRPPARAARATPRPAPAGDRRGRSDRASISTSAWWPRRRPTACAGTACAPGRPAGMSTKPRATSAPSRRSVTPRCTRRLRREVGDLGDDGHALAPPPRAPARRPGSTTARLFQAAPPLTGSTVIRSGARRAERGRRDAVPSAKPAGLQVGDEIDEPFACAPDWQDLGGARAAPREIAAPRRDRSARRRPPAAARDRSTARRSAPRVPSDASTSATSDSGDMCSISVARLRARRSNSGARPMAPRRARRLAESSSTMTALCGRSVTAGRSERTSANGRANASGSAAASAVRTNSSRMSRSRRRAETWRSARSNSSMAAKRTGLRAPPADAVDDRTAAAAASRPSSSDGARKCMTAVCRASAAARTGTRAAPRAGGGRWWRTGTRRAPPGRPAASVRAAPPIRGGTPPPARADRPAAGARPPAPSPRSAVSVVERQLDLVGIQEVEHHHVVPARAQLAQPVAQRRRARPAGP